MPIFTPERLAKIPADPIGGLLYICNFFEELEEEFRQLQNGDVKDYIECYALLRQYCAAMGFKYDLPAIQPDEKSIYAFVRQRYSYVHEDAKRMDQAKALESFEHLFSNHFKGPGAFELGEGDISEIQKLTNQLRDLISASEALGEKHKHRILSRLEAVQKEINRVQSNFDLVTGTMCEVLSVIKKIGEAAEPWTRIVWNIMYILWASQGRTYELPSSIPMPLLQNEEETK